MVTYQSSKLESSDRNRYASLMQNETLKVRLLVHKFTPSFKFSPGEIVDVKWSKDALRMVKCPTITLEEDEYEAILDEDHSLRFLRGLNEAG